MNKYGLTEKEQDEIITLFKKYSEIGEVILFGSRAMNTFTATSDIDFALKGEGVFRIIGGLISDFEESSLIYEVDVIDYQKISSEPLLEHIKKYGIVLYRKGWVETTPGEVATFQRGFDLPEKDRINGEYPLNTTLWIKDFHGNNKRFIYYFLKKFLFDKYNAGSGMPPLNRNHIHPITVLIPPLSEQKAIATVLSAFDDKIKLLREQNQTLEILAQTIFKEWFVHFNFPDIDDKPYKDNGGEMVDFDILIAPIFKKIKNNTAQIQTLAKTRDTLLPKLMSGKIRVKGFEQ